MSNRLSGGEYVALQAARRQGRGPQREPNAMGAIFNVFPLLIVPVLMYNIWAFGRTATGTSAADVRALLDQRIFSVNMASSEAGVAVQWVVSGGDLLVLVALLLLFVELLKSTSTGTAAIFNHALSMLVFIICLVEFLLHPAFATSVFFMILIMALLDVLAGVVVTIVSARRDVDFAHGS
ncbi:MAG: hypothetical protein AB7J28_07135 [Hyphomonadaceae bacterium]